MLPPDVTGFVAPGARCSCWGLSTMAGKVRSSLHEKASTPPVFYSPGRVAWTKGLPLQGVLRLTHACHTEGHQAQAHAACSCPHPPALGSCRPAARRPRGLAGFSHWTRWRPSEADAVTKCTVFPEYRPLGSSLELIITRD